MSNGARSNGTKSNGARSSGVITQEDRVLKLLSTGKSTREIADKLKITKHAVYSHKSRLTRKGRWPVSSVSGPEQEQEQEQESTQPMREVVTAGELPEILRPETPEEEAEMVVAQAEKAVEILATQARLVPELRRRLAECQEMYDELLARVKHLTESLTG